MSFLQSIYPGSQNVKETVQEIMLYPYTGNVYYMYKFPVCITYKDNAISVGKSCSITTPFLIQENTGNTFFLLVICIGTLMYESQIWDLLIIAP